MQLSQIAASLQTNSQKASWSSMAQEIMRALIDGHECPSYSPPHTFVSCLLKLSSTAAMMSESVKRITMLLIQRVLYLVPR